MKQLACAKQRALNSQRLQFATTQREVTSLLRTRTLGSVLHPLLHPRFHLEVRDRAAQLLIEAAESSARFRVPSAEIANWVKSNPGVGHVPGLLGVRGGLPIFTASGEPLGGIGVSGAPSDVDEKCAQAGIDAVLPDLRSE